MHLSMNRVHWKFYNQHPTVYTVQVHQKAYSVRRTLTGYTKNWQYKTRLAQYIRYKIYSSLNALLQHFLMNVIIVYVYFRQYSPMHYGSTQYIAVPCSVKSTPVCQVSAVHYSTVQYCTV